MPCRRRRPEQRYEHAAPSERRTRARAEAMIVICYDGSEGAQAAADQAIRLFHEAPATVLTVWALDAETRLNAELGLGSGFGVGPDGLSETAHLETRLLEQARRTAEEGAKRLRAAGIAAHSLAPTAQRERRKHGAIGGRSCQRRGSRRRHTRTRRSQVRAAGKRVP